MQRIKYDPEAWVDLGAGKTAPVPPECHLRLAEPGAVSAKFGGTWRHVGYGSEFKLSFPSATEVKASVPFSVFVSVDTSWQSKGVPLTNFDKRPGDSSVERIVKKALREQKLRQEQAARKRREADKEHAKKRFDSGLEDEVRLEDPPAHVDTTDPDGNPLPTADSPKQPSAV